MSDLIANADLFQAVSTTTTEPFELVDGENKVQKQLYAFNSTTLAEKDYKMSRKTQFGWIKLDLVNALSAKELSYVWSTGQAPDGCSVVVNPYDVIVDELRFVLLGIASYKLLQLTPKFKPTPFNHLVGMRIPTKADLLSKVGSNYCMNIMSFLSPVTYNDPVTSYRNTVLTNTLTSWLEDGHGTLDEFASQSLSPERVAVRMRLLEEQLTQPLLLKIVLKTTNYGESGELVIQPMPKDDNYLAAQTTELARKWLTVNNGYPQNEAYRAREREALEAKASLG